MPARLWYFALLFCNACALADSGQQIASIGDLRLISGQTLHDCRLGYRTAGTLDADRSNVIIVPSWFTGTSSDLMKYELIGPGKMIDTDRHHVIAIDALGNGVSSSPSNSERQPGSEFPAITIDDMVNSQRLLLSAHLGIGHVKAVIGISMGGMQTFQWIGQFPGFMDKAVPIDGSPKMTSYDLAQWRMHEIAIETMQQAGVGKAKIAEFLAAANLVTLWTPDYFVENIPAEAFPEYLSGAVQDHADMDPNDYLVQLRAMMMHDVFADHAQTASSYVETVRAEVLVVGVEQDHMVNPLPAKKLSRSLGWGYAAIDSNCGHMGTTCKAAEVAAIVDAFLE